MIYQMLRSPGWLMALARHGHPRFANIKNYAGENASVNQAIEFARNEIGGAFTWSEIARFRDKWKKSSGGQGHPASRRRRTRGGARHRRHLGVESRRPPDRGAAAADRRAAGDRRAGRLARDRADGFRVRSGLDVVRALALGAQAAFAGKAFLWGLGALGAEGPKHVIDLMVDEARASLGQIGAMSPKEARSVVIRHPGALTFPRT